MITKEVYNKKIQELESEIEKNYKEIEGLTEKLKTRMGTSVDSGTLEVYANSIKRVELRNRSLVDTRLNILFLIQQSK